MSYETTQPVPAADQATIFGHPVGLFTLFFAEMWERFSYYGMRAILLFYMLKGFLGYGDSDAYAVYGAYTALVYMTPFFGGMLADRLLGTRRAIVLGGLLMALGQACLMLRYSFSFYGGLGLLIVGNGFFKPNISNIVGTLYHQLPARRDGGFTIFYMGINLGAAMSPLLCGYIGENYGWHYGFGLATIGMLTGLAVFVAPPWVAQITIFSGAVAAAAGLLFFHPIEMMSTMVNVFVAIALVIAAIIAVVALHRGGLSKTAGAPPDPALLRKRVLGFLTIEWLVYLAALLAAPVFLLLVSGGAPLRSDGRPLVFIEDSVIEKMEQNESPAIRIAGVCLKEVGKPAGVVLVFSAILAFGYLIFETFQLEPVARHRMYVVLILIFFCLLFWAFFEQAGSSINNFTDRNVNRVVGWERTVTTSDLGKTIRLEPTQAQVGFSNGERLFTLDELINFRKKNPPGTKIDWVVSADNLECGGMRIARQADEIPASLFQAANPIYILLFGLAFTALWGFLGARGWEPSIPLKFALGLVQLSLGFAALWCGAMSADARGMVTIPWLLLGYLLHTTGELCLSPVGLSMITKLSPARLVSTVMGAWFLATAVSEFLAAVIAQFTRVEDLGGKGKIPPPWKTVTNYGNVYGLIAIAAMISAAVCFCLVPSLKRWMHEGEP